MKKTIRNVADIIDIEYLQSIQDGLGRIIGITTVLLDPQGVPLSNPTNLHAFCALMQASERGRAMCIRANGGLIEENLETGEPAVITCPNSGLRTASVPIYLGDQFLGSWLIGQIRMEDVDRELIGRTAEAAGLSKGEAIQNMESLPVISENEFDDILSFLVTVSGTLTSLVEMNSELNERNTELTGLAEQLDKSLLAFKSFIDLVDIGAYLVDYETGEVIMCNGTYRRLFEIGDGAVIGSHCYHLMGNEDFCSYCPKEKLVDGDGNATGPYVWEIFNEKRGKWLSITSRALPWYDGRLVIMTSFIDISSRKEEEERIAYLAYNDQRLDIPNNLKLVEDIEQASDESYMICIDIQGLRKINDVYGRDAGDRLLHRFVEWVHAQDGCDTMLYRVEGGSFVVLVHGCSERQAQRMASKAYARFESPWQVDMAGVSQNIYTGVHMGVIRAPEKAGRLSDLLNMIERVLSFAREKGELILFDEKMNDDLEAHLQFEVELKACVLDNLQGFYLNYQPIVDTETGRWVGLEALCRWESPTLGLVSPVVFIEEAEQLGLINVISDWVMDEAIRQTKEWGLDKIPLFVLDINLSPLQLRDRELLPKVLTLLQKYDYPPGKLSLEITETAEVSFDEMTLQVLEEIRAAGISLSLDDFGSGYATFSNLNNLPVDTLKTDRSFVSGIEDDAFLQQTIRSMIELAHAAGLITIAEGVETESQRLIMQENGVNRIQGFYYSKPLSTDVLSGMLDRFGN